MPALYAPVLRQLQGAGGGAPPGTRRCFRRFSKLQVDEIHLEMASREFAEIELIGPIAEAMDVAVGIIDVKNYYIETPEDVADASAPVPANLRRPSGCPSPRIAGSARRRAGRRRKKLKAMVDGVKRVRAELGIA